MTKLMSNLRGDRQSKPLTTEEILGPVNHDIRDLIAEPPGPAPTLEQVKEELVKTGFTVAAVQRSWDTIAKLLPRHVVLAVESQARTARCEPWQLVLGVIVHAEQSAILPCAIIDPLWKEERVFEQIGRESRCPECGVEFVPKWRGQLYGDCGCGTKKLEREEERRRLAAVEARKKADRIDEEDLRKHLENLKKSYGVDTGVQL